MSEEHTNKALDGGFSNRPEQSNEARNMPRPSPLAVGPGEVIGGRLTVLRGPLRGEVIQFDTQAELTLGRSDQAGVVIPDSGLSRVHARVFPHQTPTGIAFCIEDCGSTNGTFVGTQRISAPTMLRDGTWIGLGRRTVLSFSWQAVSDGEEPHRVSDSSLRDQLTGVYNGAAFDDCVRSDLILSRHAGCPLVALLFEVDQFKYLSDSSGHRAGDSLLCRVIQTVQAALRRQDVLGRYPGGEFAAILHNATRRSARALAEQARSAVETQEIHRAGSDIRATVSVGGVHSTGFDFATGDAIKDPAVLIDIAARALHEAKEQGGNRVVMVARGLE